MKNVLLILALFLGFMLACNDDDDNETLPSNEIRMSDSTFIPVNTSVSAGTTVRWLNNSSVAHTVTSNDELFDAYLQVGEDFSFTFDNPGTYNYMCVIHQGMVGSIVVR